MKRLAFVPLLVTTGTGTPDGPRRHRALAVTGARVSSVRRDDGGRLEVRLFNPSDRPVEVDLGSRRGWRADLRGRATGAVDGSFELAPWALTTVILPE